MNANVNDTNAFDRDRIAKSADAVRADVRDTIDQAADKVQPVIDTVARSAQEGAKKTRDTLNDVADSLTARSKDLAVAYDRFSKTGREYVTTRPATSVLVALAAGYGLAKIFSARK
jgi:ElaB/YqjD/DUF883 family membrane-anchored ribosome-binding protein